MLFRVRKTRFSRFELDEERSNVFRTYSNFFAISPQGSAHVAAGRLSPPTPLGGPACGAMEGLLSFSMSHLSSTGQGAGGEKVYPDDSWFSLHSRFGPSGVFLEIDVFLKEPLISKAATYSISLKRDGDGHLSRRWHAYLSPFHLNAMGMAT